MKKLFMFVLCFLLSVQMVYAEEPEEKNEIEIRAPSAILMESSTGTILYEKDSESRRPPASVTKIMTLLLTFEALESGKIQLTDEVVTSEYAASMGGSQVFLEPGEIQTVDTLIKCIAVASANDACVAMAEHICGSEEAFVKQMNQRAKELGMDQTQFQNCNGLDTEGHLTTAKDIAKMSRELIVNHPQIRDYCMIWQENIVHTTKKGSSEFGLTNTNKLVRHYEYATGLKTGSTSQAKFCISATGEKDGLELIAVIMAADTSKERNADAVALLNYGFSKCQKYEEKEVAKIPDVKILRGTKETIKVVQKTPFSYLDLQGVNLNQIERTVTIKDPLVAPIQKGEKVGMVQYRLKGQLLGEVDVVAEEEVKELTYLGMFVVVLKEYFQI